MHMKNIHIKGCLLAVFFLILSCNSTEPPTPPQEEEEETIEYDIRELIDRIRVKSGLVKDITSSAVEDLAPGLSYAKIQYNTNADKPMAVYILHANLKENVTLVASAAANGKDLNAKETVRKQTEYVKERGHQVLAAVNADFWRVNANETDNTPMGQAYGAIYMDGEMIKDVTRTASQYYFAAIKNDGSFLMGDKLALLRASKDIKEALGARYLLVKDGKDVSGQISNTDIAPRTSIGELDAHNVVFIVVDGRRPDHSQGVTMQELGKIYEAIGVKTAVNLDGGGSSTLILNEESNQFVLKNRPSDNTERNVANSWAIVKK